LWKLCQLERRECEFVFEAYQRVLQIPNCQNRFRWATCQIHALQRLKGENNIVRNALKNLPQTLDETYERIFLEIPDEDRIFVHHALQWIYYHHELHHNNISCSILLQGIERSTCESTPSGRDYFYDEERLRELCGCLITVMPENRSNYFINYYYPTRTVSFAHYTVWELLDSVRVLKSSAAFFAVIKERTKLEFTKTVILEALDTQPNDLWYRETDFDELSDIADAVEEDFNGYSVASSISTVRHWGHDLSKHNELRALTFNLLDPSKPHFREFAAAASQIEAALLKFSDSNILAREQFWNIIWKTPPKNTDAAILINLMQLDESCELAKRFLEKINIQELLQTQLNLNIEVLDDEYDSKRYNFEGSIIELYAQFAGNLRFGRPEHFTLLLEEGAEFFDPSLLLLSFVGSHDFHDHHIKYDCDYCPLSRLLQLGATANVSGYRVTPLQIAVASSDFEGVKMLLEAGADPNGTGDSGGIEWKEGSLLARFNHLGGVNPLRICREFEITYDGYEDREGVATRIKEIILQYGAKGA